MGIEKIIAEKLNNSTSKRKKNKIGIRKRKVVLGRLKNQKRSLIGFVLRNDKWVKWTAKKYRAH